MKMSLFLFILLSKFLVAAEVITEKKHVLCEEFILNQELKVYKDPSFFIPNLNLMYTDPKQGWDVLMEETPVLTSLKGAVHIMLLGEPQEFKNFGAISRFYELSNSHLRAKPIPYRKPMIIPVKICGDSYGDSLGFVVESELKVALSEEREGGRAYLPPSTRKNPIPKLPR